MALVTVEVAKKHLRYLPDDQDADINLKVDAASQIIEDYLGAQFDATWTIDTVPADVRAAVLLVVGHLWGSRGDDDMKLDEALWAAIRRLLERRRDPVLA